MREIKFRAKRVDNGEWCYGYYVVSQGKPYMIAESLSHEGINGIISYSVEVILETVGQFTGLLDTNGLEIYEGDIGWDKYNESTGVVMFDEGKFKFVWENIVDDLSEVHSDIEIIGNIHENKKREEEDE